MENNKKQLLLILFNLNLGFTTFSQGNLAPKRHYLKIVLFIADDLAANDIGIYGNNVVRTPNLDKLGYESLLFSNAFASSPTCAPSRASIHTGLYPFKNGAHINHTG